MTHQYKRVQYCLHLLCYVDDIQCIYHNADSVLQHQHQCFLLKPEYENPDMYLDDKLHKTRLYNGKWTWAMFTNMYVRQSEMPIPI